jgi:hypothetical protein
MTANIETFLDQGVGDLPIRSLQPKQRKPYPKGRDECDEQQI